VTSPGGFCVSNEPGCFGGDSGLIDSVGNGGNGNVGHSLYGADGSLTLNSVANVLGALLTAAGLVWTGGNNINFDACCPGNVFLGGLIGSHAANSSTGGTAEDRFYGVINAGGISRLVIFNPPGIEIDHVQYGVGLPVSIDGVVPEPSAWALMLTGFFGDGGMLGARRRALRLAA
jgi:hypothetical protein